jgi:hypothetical protein
MKISKGNSLIPMERIEHVIFLIRGQKVILDKDLAMLYQVSTSNLNSVVAKIFSEISFSPPHLKGNKGSFDGHRTSPLVSFAPPTLTLPLAGGRGGWG